MKCGLCPEYLPNWELYRSHLNNRHRTTLSLSCEQCVAEVESREDMKTHYRRYHPRQERDVRYITYRIATQEFGSRWWRQRSRIVDRGAKYESRKRKDGKRADVKDTEWERISDDALSVTAGEDFERMDVKTDESDEAVGNMTGNKKEKVEGAPKEMGDEVVRGDQEEGAEGEIPEDTAESRRKNLKLRIKKRLYVEMDDDSDDDELVLRLRRPRIGFRRVIRVDVISRYYVEAFGETRLLRSSTDSMYPEENLRVTKEE